MDYQYHMWKAYYAALTAEDKEPLIFARILMMMGDEQHFKQSDYTRLHRYYLPAKEQYQIAIEAELKPTEKELEYMKQYTYSLIYQFECEDKPYDEQVSYIEGHEILSDFGFHDSKVVFFSHDEKSATMTRLNRKLIGTNNYYSVSGAIREVRKLYSHAMWVVLKWMNRRSQRRSFTKEKFSAGWNEGIRKPYIHVNIWAYGGEIYN